MKYKECTYEQLVNLGNYENRKFSVTVALEEGDDPRDVYDDIKAFVIQQLYKGGRD